jgi:hypothetical protein
MFTTHSDPGIARRLENWEENVSYAPIWGTSLFRETVDKALANLLEGVIADHKFPQCPEFDGVPLSGY